MRTSSGEIVWVAALWAVVTTTGGCSAERTGAGGADAGAPVSGAPAGAEASSVEIPESARRWMDRLTVKTRYDPATGFIVAEEVVPLPAVLRDGPGLDAAGARAKAEGRPLLVFVTADRCGPCQQYKRDAVNDPRVVAALEAGRASGAFEAAHAEADRETEAVERVVGSTGIPMTYWVRGDRVVATLRGQRSGDELLAFIQAGPGDASGGGATRSGR